MIEPIEGETVDCGNEVGEIIDFEGEMDIGAIVGDEMGAFVGKVDIGDNELLAFGVTVAVGNTVGAIVLVGKLVGMFVFGTVVGSVVGTFCGWKVGFLLGFDLVLKFGILILFFFFLVNFTTIALCDSNLISASTNVTVPSKNTTAIIISLRIITEKQKNEKRKKET